MPAGSPASPAALAPGGSLLCHTQRVGAPWAAGHCPASSPIPVESTSCLVSPAASKERFGGVFLPFRVLTELAKENINFPCQQVPRCGAALLRQLGRAGWTAELPGELPFHPFLEQQRRDMPAPSPALPSADL